MKYAAVILAAAVGVQAQAWKRSANVTVTTEVVDEYVTYCPGPTQVTHGDKVYTVTAPTTLTITDCPCTITKPVTQPTVPAASGTGVAPTKSGPSVVPTAAAGKNAALTGAGLAGIVGFAAFVL